MSRAKRGTKGLRCAAHDASDPPQPVRRASPGPGARGNRRGAAASSSTPTSATTAFISRPSTATSTWRWPRRRPFFTVAPWGYRVLLPWLGRQLSPTQPGCGLLLVDRPRADGGRHHSLHVLAAAGQRPPPPRSWLSRSSARRVRWARSCATSSWSSRCTVVPWSSPSCWPSQMRGRRRSRWLCVALAGTLSKEFFLLLLPLVYLVRRGRDGDGRALAQALLVSIPCLLAAWLLRAYWTPHIAPPIPSTAPGALAGRLDPLRRDLRELGPGNAAAWADPARAPWRVAHARAATRTTRACYLVLATLDRALPEPGGVLRSGHPAAAGVRAAARAAAGARRARSAAGPALPAALPPVAWPGARERLAAVVALGHAGAAARRRGPLPAFRPSGQPGCLARAGRVP